MELQLIRNAALKIKYAGKTILIDPDLGAKHSRASFTGKSQNPMVELPCSLEEIIEGVELVIVSHLHQDHFDTVAQERLPKELPLFCQPEDDAKIITKGFQQVQVIEDSVEWQGIKIQRVGGHHGLGEVENLMGKVSGFVLQAANAPIIYWAGDTVMCAEVRETIAKYQPDVIITHSCGAMWTLNEERVYIVMDAEQTIETANLAPKSILIATHMEALDHATVSRDDLRMAANQAGINRERLLIPEDGENIILNL